MKEYDGGAFEANVSVLLILNLILTLSSAYC